MNRGRDDNGRLGKISVNSHRAENRPLKLCGRLEGVSKMTKKRDALDIDDRRMAGIHRYLLTETDGKVQTPETFCNYVISFDALF